MTHKYITFAKAGNCEIEVLKSRFIAQGKTVLTVAEAEDFLKNVQTQYPDATHHCYAFKIQGPPAIERYSDAGEPSGTAGKPIYTVLFHHLTNAIIVITRYYGGTKLGKGGLVKAYTEAAKALIESLGLSEQEPEMRYILSFPYSLHNQVSYLLQKYQLQADFQFEVEVSTGLNIPESLVRTVTEELQALPGLKLAPSDT